MKQFIVIGAGRFGTAVANTLIDAGCEVLVIDSDVELVQKLSETIENVAIVDATDKVALNSIGLGNFDVAIIAIGTDLKASIMATLLAKEEGVPVVISKAADTLQAAVLQKIGADKVVFPESDMGKKLGKRMAYWNILDYMELDAEHSIFNIMVPQKWIGKNAKTINIRKKYRVAVVGKISEGNVFHIPIDPEIPFEKNDILIVAGKNEHIEFILSMEQ